ncbi:MAG: gliding motility-associated C-terminal domain-containing protein, partial [Flavobacteriaceae bacterium]
MSKLYVFFIGFCLLFSGVSFAQQEFGLVEQLNGRYDFTFIGNTMNTGENNFQSTCVIETSSSAVLNLQADDQIEKAYLYWSGSGSGVNTIKLNDQDVTADNLYSLNTLNLSFFVAFAEVTQQVQNTGNGTYTVSEFDLTAIIPQYCPNATNYAGWGLVVFYENENLPMNQLSLFDGFNHISGSGNGAVIGEVSITLDNLYIANTAGAKIGFMAWEGDTMWQLHESLLLNGEKLSDPPLNPEYNIFNSTNSTTGSSELYNMDLDIYDAQNYVEVGDTSAEVKLTSGQDFVLISTIVTKFNNNHPDATISIDQISTQCDLSEVEIDYTVYNNDAQNFLPAGTPIAIYINGDFLQTVYTQNNIEINESESGSVIIDLPGIIEEEIEVLLVVDDIGDGTGIVHEINEENNQSEPFYITLFTSPSFNALEDIISCNTGSQTAVFDFSEYENSVKQNETDSVSFHTSHQEATNNLNPITNTSDYEVVNESDKEIFVRIDNGNCHSITSFFLHTIDCTEITIVIDKVITLCDSNQIEIHYTVFNNNLSYILPPAIPIEVFINQNLVQTVYTQDEILPGASESGVLSIILDQDIQDFEVLLVINIDNGNVSETISSTIVESFLIFSPEFNSLEDLTECNIGHNTAVFDFSEYEYAVRANDSDFVSFHTSYQETSQNINPISDISSYAVQNDFPKEIFVRIANEYCFSITSFFLNIRKCPPLVYNGVSANNDGYNDHLIIDGLYDIFMDFELYIYSRWGELIWKGNNNTP